MKCLHAFIVSLTLMLFSQIIFAQRQQVSGFFYADLPYGIHGDYKYGYVVEENGKNTLDGPFTMIGSIDESKDGYKYWYTVRATGKYNLKGNHSHGNLHGPMTLNANLNISVSNGEKGSFKYFLNGNYKNGIPDGNFVVNYEGELLEKVNVTYKDGVLVGSYYASGANTEDLGFEIKGTLTQDGKMTGEWIITNKTREFLNGVEITTYDKELKDKAKLYAEGKMTKKELENEGIYVASDKINLGSRVKKIILNDIINYEELGFCDFSKSNDVYYEYLMKLPTIGDAGFKLFISDFLSDSMARHICSGDENGEFLGYIQYDWIIKRYFISLLRDDKYSQFCKGYPKWNGLTKIYLSAAQVEEFTKAIDDLHKSNAVDVEKLDENVERILDNVIKTTVSSINNYRKIIKLNNLDQQRNQIIEAGCKNAKNQILSFANGYLPSRKFGEVGQTKDFYKMRINNDFVYFTKDFWIEYNVLNGKYEELVQDSSNDMQAIEKIKMKLDNYYKIFLDKLTQLVQDEFNDIKESLLAEVNDAKLKIKPSLDYLLDKKKASDILYSSESDKIFDASGCSEYWRLDLGKLLKQLLPIVSIEVIDINVIDNGWYYVECVLITYNKKGNIKRNIELEFVKGTKITVSSLMKACNTPGVVDTL